jgi:heterodisulfide reductase subunit B
MIELTGATSVHWDMKLRCCGSPLLISSEEVATKILREKMISANGAGANCVVTNCPACHTQFDIQQLGLKDDEGNSIELPALFVTQVLGLAMGIDPEPLGFELNRVSLDPIKEILGV